MKLQVPVENHNAHQAEQDKREDQEIDQHKFEQLGVANFLLLYEVAVRLFAGKAIDSLAASDLGCQTVGMHLLRTVTSFNKLCRYLQVLEIVGFVLHVGLQLKQQRSQGSFWQSFDLLVIFVKKHRR